MCVCRKRQKHVYCCFISASDSRKVRTVQNWIRQQTMFTCALLFLRFVQSAAAVTKHFHTDSCCFGHWSSITLLWLKCEWIFFLIPSFMHFRVKSGWSMSFEFDVDLKTENSLFFLPQMFLKGSFWPRWTAVLACKKIPQPWSLRMPWIHSTLNKYCGSPDVCKGWMVSRRCIPLAHWVQQQHTESPISFWALCSCTLRLRLGMNLFRTDRRGQSDLWMFLFFKETIKAFKSGKGAAGQKRLKYNCKTLWSRRGNIQWEQMCGGSKCISGWWSAGLRLP